MRKVEVRHYKTLQLCTGDCQGCTSVTLCGPELSPICHAAHSTWSKPAAFTHSALLSTGKPLYPPAPDFSLSPHTRSSQRVLLRSAVRAPASDAAIDHQLTSACQPSCLPQCWRDKYRTAESPACKPSTLQGRAAACAVRCTMASSQDSCGFLKSCGRPACHMATSSVPVLSSRHRKGWFLGTAGGAPAPLQPTVSILTPEFASTGTAPRVRPSTSLCTAQRSRHACVDVQPREALPLGQVWQS